MDVREGRGMNGPGGSGLSVIIPVYRNAANIPSLLMALSGVAGKLEEEMEVVFVVDGSPDDSMQLLLDGLPGVPYRSQVVLLSRNFGSFNAVRAGLEVATGSRFAAVAADLQEPPELLLEFNRLLASGETDLVLGRRKKRSDPLLARMFAGMFWRLYRRWVMPDVPEGGVDVFACNAVVRDTLLQLGEHNTSVVGLLFWMGHRRVFLDYERRSREVGESAWSMSRRVRYLIDSIYGFSDLPIRMLFAVGLLGIGLSMAFTTIIIFARLVGVIAVPGYAATMTAILFFGAANLLGLGIIGGYLWRTFENTKGRPNYLVARRAFVPPDSSRFGDGGTLARSEGSSPHRS